MNNLRFYKVASLLLIGLVSACGGGKSNDQSSTPRKLNDTGITLCGTADDSNNNADCTTAVANATGSKVPKGQDGHYATGKDGSKGMAFSHVKDFKGQCVQDERTGLMWEVKQATEGLHYKDNTYTWYNTDKGSNGGWEGRPKGVSCGEDGNDCETLAVCKGSDCDTDAFVKAVNSTGWCGYKDWRLPTREELRSIIDYSKSTSFIDTNFFPNTQRKYYWTASPSAEFDKQVWLANFREGNDLLIPKNSFERVRLVRAR